MIMCPECLNISLVEIASIIPGESVFFCKNCMFESC